MAKEYNVGSRLYLPVWVTDMETNVTMGQDKSTVITDAKFAYVYCFGRNNTGAVRYGEEGLLLTAEEVADNIDLITRATLEEYREGAVRRIQELETECEKWKATAQNCENSAKAADNAADNLRLENKKLKAENGNLKANAAENADTISRLSANKIALTEEVGRLRETIADRTKDVQHITEESTELKAEYDELKSRNAELEALLKEVMATRDEAIKQNNELIAENKNLKEWYNEANKTASEAAEANDELKAKIAELRDENEKLKAELGQRNKDFWAMKKDRDELDCIGGKLRAENEKLTAERDDLKSKVGKYTADIQDMAAEIHFHKEFGEGLDKQQKELQARYDELDSVNKEQAEKIRMLDAGRDTWERNAKAWKMTADGMSKRAEELQAENEKLNNRNKYLESEKNRKPIVHVLTNDGHVYAFTSSGKVSVKYHTEHNILTIEDGEKAIAGFSRGDKPGNLSAWWMG